MEEEAQNPPRSPPPHYNAVPPPPEYWENPLPGPPPPIPAEIAWRLDRGRKLILSIILLCCLLYGVEIYYEHQYSVCNASYEAIRTRLRAFYHGPDPFWKVWSHSHRVPDVFYPCTYFQDQLLVIQRHFVLNLDNCRSGRWHTLFTSTFMHYSIWPLLYDLWDVFFWGIPLITVFGIGHFSSIYVLGGIIGGLCRLYFDLLIEEMGGYSSRSSVGASDSISALMAVLALTVPLYPIPFFYVPFLGSVCALITGWSFLYSLGAFFGFWGVGVSHGHLAGYLVGLLYWVIVLKRPIFGLSIDQTFSFIRKEISSIKSKV